MPRTQRILFPGAFYHVYNRGVEKKSIVFSDIDRKAFLQLLGETVKQFRLRLFAYCLMDNHFHLFLQTPLPNLDEAMQALQGAHARHMNFYYERVGPLFQGRYKSRLVDADRYALSLTRYIHHNPIEAGIVIRLEDYAWSSYPCYVGQLPQWNWLDTQWLLNLFNAASPTEAVKSFQAFHHGMPTESELTALKRLRVSLGKPATELSTRGLTPFR